MRETVDQPDRPTLQPKTLLNFATIHKIWENSWGTKEGFFKWTPQTKPRKNVPKLSVPQWMPRATLDAFWDRTRGRGGHNPPPTPTGFPLKQTESSLTSRRVLCLGHNFRRGKWINFLPAFIFSLAASSVWFWENVCEWTFSLITFPTMECTVKMQN